MDFVEQRRATIYEARVELNQAGAGHQARHHVIGGHFPAMEAPEALVDDVRTFFRGLR